MSLDALAARIIDYVETYPWNNQYTIKGRLEQRAEVVKALIQAYDLGAERLLSTLEKAAAGCGDAGCVEHGFTGPSPAPADCGPCDYWGSIESGSPETT